MRLCCRTLLLSVCAVFTGLSTSSAWAQPTRVYFWNTRVNPNDANLRDQGDNVSEASIWRELGLMTAEGRPGTVDNQDRIIVGGNVVGHLIRRAGNIIGVRNDAGTFEAYDLTTAATIAGDGWARVANNGRLDVRVHGPRQRLPDGTVRAGGALMVGNGTFRDGFRQTGAAGNGTGLGMGAPVDLPARAGANLTMDLNVCFSSNDPDGIGAIVSVTQSATTVNGVGQARGHMGVSTTQLGHRISGGTLQQRQNAMRAVFAEARRRGFLNDAGRVDRMQVDRMLASIPFREHGAILDIANNATNNATQMAITYNTIAPQRGDPSDPDVPTATENYYTPVLQIDAFSSGEAVYTAYDLPESLAPASMRVTPDDLSSTTILHINQLADLPAPAPIGLPALGSGVFDFAFNHMEPPVSGVLEYRLRLADDITDPQMFFYEPLVNDWTPVPSVIDGLDLVGTFNRVGIFTVFAVPEPGFGAIALFATLLTVRRRH